MSAETGESVSLRERIEGAWAEFRAAVAALSPDEFDQRTPSGWTVKEMVAHVAFWEETVAPFIEGMLRERGWPALEDWYGGAGLDTAQEWPAADVHNAREAAWARGRSVADVLQRLDRAHIAVLEVVDGLTPDELADERFVQHVSTETFGHYPEHLEELRSTFPPGLRGDGRLVGGEGLEPPASSV